MCRRKAVLIAPGQDRLLTATSDLTSVAMTNKKQNPARVEGSVASATARNNEGAREGGRGGMKEKKGDERQRGRGKDKLKGRSDMENTKIQGACYYSHQSYACCQNVSVFRDFNYHLFPPHTLPPKVYL